mmetsp:Transcript_55079/g.66309  ORF Transcript_55079/g.66309 Transcript_55079/m.66309 type:complete len:251 (+) Transcript_55079:124-876(+)
MRNLFSLTNDILPDQTITDDKNSPLTLPSQQHQNSLLPPRNITNNNIPTLHLISECLSHITSSRDRERELISALKKTARGRRGWNRCDDDDDDYDVMEHLCAKSSKDYDLSCTSADDKSVIAEAVEERMKRRRQRQGQNVKKKKIMCCDDDNSSDNDRDTYSDDIINNHGNDKNKKEQKEHEHVETKNSNDDLNKKAVELFQLFLSDATAYKKGNGDSQTTISWPTKESFIEYVDEKYLSPLTASFPSPI